MLALRSQFWPQARKESSPIQKFEGPCFTYRIPTSYTKIQGSGGFGTDGAHDSKGISPSLPGNSSSPGEGLLERKPHARNAKATCHGSAPRLRLLRRLDAQTRPSPNRNPSQLDQADAGFVSVVAGSKPRDMGGRLPRRLPSADLLGWACRPSATQT